MIFAFIANAIGWLKRLPPAAWYAAAGLALIVGFLIWNHYDNKAAIEADRAATNAKAQETARGADETARGKIDATRNEVEQGNADAKNAASGSDDPLKAGLDALGLNRR